MCGLNSSRGRRELEGVHERDRLSILRNRGSEGGLARFFVTEGSLRGRSEGLPLGEWLNFSEGLNFSDQPSTFW